MKTRGFDLGSASQTRADQHGVEHSLEFDGVGCGRQSAGGLVGKDWQRIYGLRWTGREWVALEQ